MDKALLERLIVTAQKSAPQTQGGMKVDKRFARYIEKYEKLRNIVGFHDEHAWRRYAIERIIKRHLFLTVKQKPSTESLLQELVLARYIGENSVTPQAIQAIDAVITKYLRAADYAVSTLDGGHTEMRDWFLGIMAVEIEGVLGLLDHEYALIEAFRAELQKRFQFPSFYLQKEQEDVFIIMAAAASLIKADHKFIAYLLIRQWYGAWFTRTPSSVMREMHSQKDLNSDEGRVWGFSQSEDAIKPLVGQVWQLKSHIAHYQKHDVYSQVMRIAKKQAVPFLVLDEVIKKYGGSLQPLQKRVETVIEVMNANVQKKVKRQVWHSFVYLLITKLSLIIILEVPFEMWKDKEIGVFQAMINLVSPVILLLILTISIRAGSRENTSAIIQEVDVLVHEGKTDRGGKVTLPQERSLGKSLAFNTLFLLAYIFSYGIIIWALNSLHFNVVSGWLFVLFITLVTYLAIRIRFTAERFWIIERGTRIGRELLYFFALPILWSGRWLVKRFSQYNFFIAFFDLLFEAPYKTLIFLFRDFADFTREKREMMDS